ncbi:hypothetical protein ACH5RR_023425 [Cinchona calisaya]|uniref:Uncharacterized protein n=1 Tax=Cinchona calisaya TaxID=153742 RepID=A0ABD2ZAP8_9GENT
MNPDLGPGHLQQGTENSSKSWAELVKSRGCFHDGVELSYIPSGAEEGFLSQNSFQLLIEKEYKGNTENGDGVDAEHEEEEQKGQMI